MTTKRTARAWLYKEQLREILERKQVNVVRGMLLQWATNVMRSKVQPMKAVAKMIRRYLDGIVAWTQTRQTNGFLEAINGLFQAAKHRARGYGNFSTIRTVSSCSPASSTSAKSTLMPLNPLEIQKPQSYAAAQDFIRQIRRYGCRFSLDDFGSGYTSYAHLKNLRTDSLKIDGAFVKDMLSSPSDYAMVKSMHDIGHSLGMHTVAEYVESPMILSKLREIGVDYAQGYAIHKPCRIGEIGLT